MRRVLGKNLIRAFLLIVSGLSIGSGSAAAGFLSAGVDSCAKPLAVPDRFNDVDGNTAWTDMTDFYDPGITGYSAPGDVGLQLSIYAGAPPAVAPGQYFLVNFPPLDQGTPLTGETWFREWMSGCAPYPVAIEESLQIEPGNLLNTLVAMVDSLIDSDSTAVWDGGAQSVVGSEYEASPRILTFPFYDPSIEITSGRSHVLVRKIVRFFLESRGPGSRITGRIVDVISSGDTPVQPATWGRLKNLYRTKGSN